MTTEPITAKYVPLLDHEDDYEILNEYPFTIRRKKDQYEISEYLSSGYVQVSLNSKTYHKHKLIAKQFIPNDDPEHKKYIDHINRDRADYHLENLRWCSNSCNQKNRSSTCKVKYTFVDEIYEDSIEITDYGTHQFEDYYFDDTVDKFYFWNGLQFRELHINVGKDGSKSVNMVDVNHKRTKVIISKLKRLYDLA